MASFSGNIVDIPGKRIFSGKLEITDGRISDIVECGPQDPSSAYILPGFIDSHIHIESTLMTPANFAPVAASRGVTGVIADPHEIANVLGVEGVEFMLENAALSRFNFHFAASPCVPSTVFETSGATLDSNDVRELLKRPGIYGLGEMMNVPGLVFSDSEVLAKIAAARELGKPIDGHAPGYSEEWIAKCAEAGISTDHECSTLEEAHLRLKYGMKVIIREGSAARNYDALAPLLGEDEYADSILFCSDDKYANELCEGYIDSLVRESVRRGYPLWNVLKAACINPVLHYGIADGILRKGDWADFIVVDNLRDFHILDARVGGGKAGETTVKYSHIPNRFKALPLKTSDIEIKAETPRVRIIKASDGSLWTDSLVDDARIENGMAVSDPSRDILKIIVLNRYEPGKKPAIGFISGFSFKKGAMACSIGHDSHNIIATGVNDEEILKVANAIVECRGGMAVSDGEHLETLPLPVAGLMSDRPCEEVAGNYNRLLKLVAAAGCPFNAPFMTMSFMPLPVIPRLKLTDKGLFDGEKFCFTELFV